MRERLGGVIAVVLLWALQADAAAPLRLDAVLGDDGGGGFARADAPRKFEFPRDHGPHPEYRSEWWYLTASLRGPEGEAYGVQYTLFRQGLRSAPVIGGPWDASQVYLGHLALTDVAAASHREAERLARAHPRLAGVRAAPFRAWLDGWTLAASGPGLSGLELEADAGEAFAVALELEPEQPVVFQGEQGLSRKGPGQASYYYSLPRLAVSGTIRTDSGHVPVTGSAWLDREWSTSVLSEQQVGWDWFALHLDAGAELMAFQLRRRDGTRDPYDQGLWVPDGGAARRLTAADFQLEPLRYWRDDEGVRWPVSWRLVVETPGGTRTLRVEAALDDQRMDTLLTYWEGLVRVLDTDGRRVGTGYMELTGYE
ncbi:MAG: lipocalin-like domain-containing protein [Pseudomonadota bacterium]